MWVRGLKQYAFHTRSKRNSVAPYVGAWIETILVCVLASNVSDRVRSWYVAPYVGAWIETILVCVLASSMQSRTLCGCVD